MPASKQKIDPAIYDTTTETQTGVLPAEEVTEAVATVTMEDSPARALQARLQSELSTPSADAGFSQTLTGLLIAACASTIIGGYILYMGL